MTTLARSRQQRMIAGVMGGIAARYGWNVSLLRLIFVLVSVFSAAVPGVFIYLILWMIMPNATISRPDQPYRKGTPSRHWQTCKTSG
jgi:phage shock protein C